MPKPTVTANSRTFRTVVPDPATGLPHDPMSSPDIPDDQHWNRLSYLHGSAGTDDMGCQDYYESYPGSYATWESRRNLRRHTIEQGSSTFSFPQKK